MASLISYNLSMVGKCQGNKGKADTSSSAVAFKLTDLFKLIYTLVAEDLGPSEKAARLS